MRNEKGGRVGEEVELSFFFVRYQLFFEPFFGGMVPTWLGEVERWLLCLNFHPRLGKMSTRCQKAE